MNREDPLRKYCFAVQIDGIAVASFQSVTGLNVETQMTEYREGTFAPHPRKLPGMQTYPNITLTRGYTQANSVFWEWHRTIVNGDVQRRDGSVILCDEAGVDRFRWDWEQGWLCQLSGAELDAASNDVAVQLAVICIEKLTATFLS